MNSPPSPCSVYNNCSQGSRKHQRIEKGTHRGPDEKSFSGILTIKENVVRLGCKILSLGYERVKNLLSVIWD